MSIYLFNLFGNGDVFFNMPYINDIASQHDVVYCHQQSPRLLLDKNFKSEQAPFTRKQIRGQKVVSYNNNNYINCHVGAYFDVFPDRSVFGTTLTSFHQMFTLIYQQVNQIHNTNLSIKDLEYYFHDIDYSFYQTQQIDQFFENTQYDRKVLICNGTALSGQCSGYNGDMKPIVETLATEFSNVLFLCATKFNTQLKNINFCDDIIGHDLNNHNLNELSYISSKCDIIAGKNSGQFCFCSTRKNLFDKSKKMIVFGSHKEKNITTNVEFDWNLSFHVIQNAHDILELLLTQIKI